MQNLIAANTALATATAERKAARIAFEADINAATSRVLVDAIDREDAAQARTDRERRKTYRALTV